jgi:hypothetical protein
MKRDMTTLDLIVLLRKSRSNRSSYLPMWEDLARGHYRDLRSAWIGTNNKTLADWRKLESEIQTLMWQAGNYAEDWLKFAYNQVIITQ